MGGKASVGRNRQMIKPEQRVSLNVYVSKIEKRIIEQNAFLKDYKSTSAFLRELGLGTDISNNTLLAILLVYLKTKLENYSPEKSLNWVRKKQWNDIKVGVISKFSGMKKDKYDMVLKKLDETISHAVDLKKELMELLKKRREND